MKIYAFKAKIEKNPDMDAAYIVFPYDAYELFGKKRVLVRATFDKEEYDGQLVRMETPYHIIGINKNIRKKIDKKPGDFVDVTIYERKK